MNFSISSSRGRLAAASLSPRAYLAAAAASLAAGLALLWIWVAVAPLAFLDQEYPSFLAKRMMLERCNLGHVLVIGDSRAAADIVADQLPDETTNLAIGGGGPVEGYFLLRRAFSCPRPPDRIVLSFTAQHLTHADTLWERSMRFGLLTRTEIDEVSQVSDRLGDHAFSNRLHDGMPDGVRAWLYAVRFPALYANSLFHAVGALRYERNLRILDAVLEHRGHYEFGNEEGSSAIAIEGWMSDFRPEPVLDHYMDRLLALADARGLPVRFVAMPVNNATFAASNGRMREGFTAYLSGYERRYPGFSFQADLLPHWPDRLFGDGFSHLNARGALIATARFAECLQPPAAACDWTWYADARD